MTSVIFNKIFNFFNRKRALPKILRFSEALLDGCVTWKLNHGHSVFHRVSVCYVFYRIRDDSGLRELRL